MHCHTEQILWFKDVRTKIGATTECRATFKHSPNKPARLARQWMKERGIIVCTLSVGFIYLVARLARQWKNFYSIKC